MTAVLTRSTTSGNYSRLNNSHYVLILGWGGSDDKSVKKYADLYEKRGLDTIRFIAEMKAFSPQGLAGMRDMDEIFPVLDQVQDQRLVMHIFSMNGAYSLVTLLHHKKYADLFSRTDGIIWDSCPIYADFMPFLKSYNQIMNNMHKKQLESGSIADWGRVQARKAVALSQNVMEAARNWVHVKTGGNISEVHPYFYLREHPQMPERHTLFYSEADVLCPAPTIRAFNQYLSEKRGKEVDAVYFTDSAHVKHFLVHPVEYNEGIDRMLSYVERIYHPNAKI
ncbi:hypothetical protein PENTCL1PPCAC_21636 [Pristionchus entomophagus]|uniref:Uncharacterized protein n=1 Tax=Pristionchus entomophagus TaxID=358040 RepID=A0AAV5TYX9_9BILA|nr:hypothetical protein PENTCL1PPCAC_21636 [Pristionchus entomophagus]